MGTSVSQGSPRNINWNAVLSGYRDEFVSENRILSEIWRAYEKEKISNLLKTTAIFDCYTVVSSSRDASEAIARYDSYLSEKKRNSIIAEIAKRTIPTSFEVDQPSNAWMARLFSEITNYVLSRDVSGFVGESYRNKSVKELIEFKDRLRSKVIRSISEEKVVVRSIKEWRAFVDNSVNKLKSISDAKD